MVKKEVNVEADMNKWAKNIKEIHFYCFRNCYVGDTLDGEIY